jgi:hypothetical protein
MDAVVAFSWFGGLVASAGFFLLSRGIVFLWRRQWRAGGLHLLAFPAVQLVALAGVPVTVLALVAAGVIPPATNGIAADPSEKARILAETIAEVMNASVWLVIPGLIAGFAFKPPRPEP